MTHRMLTVAQLADLFGVHRNTIIREIGRGRLRSVKIGHVHRFTPEDVDAYLVRHRASP